VKPAFTTKRLVVFQMSMVISETLCAPRYLFVAFPREDDMPRVICTMLVTQAGTATPHPWLDWIATDEDFRRKGFAAEMWAGVVEHIGPLIADGASKAGDALCKKMENT